MSKEPPAKKEFNKAPPVKDSKAGATPGLAVFDFNATRLDARLFNEAQRDITDFATIHYGRVAHIFEFGSEFDFNILKPPKVPKKAPVVTPPAVPAEKEKDKDKRNKKALEQEQVVAISSESAAAADDDSDEEVERERYKRKMFEHDKVIMTYQENKIRMYGVLYGQLTLAMRHKIQEADNFEEIKEEKDLLALWLLVKRVSLEDRSTGTSNIFKRVDDARNIFNRIRQFNGEKVGDYYERFITEAEAAEANGVEFGNPSYVKDLIAKDKRLDRHDAKAMARECELSMIFIQKLDKKRYGSMLEEWENKLNDGEDVYPKTLAEAIRRVNNRKMDPRNNNGIAGQGMAFVSQQQNQQSDNSAYLSKVICFFCNQPGHKKKDCPMLKQAFEMFQADMKKQQTEGKVAVAVGRASNCCDSDEEGFGFCTVADHHVFSNAVVEACETLGSFDLLCDNQATVSIVHNRALLKNIRKATKPMTISGIGGSLVAEEVGDLGKFGEVYYHPKSIANILCFHDLAKRYSVVYNSKIKDEFIVTTDVKTIVFAPKGKLYVYNPMKSGENSGTVLIQTVAENAKRYTKKEVSKAEEARDLYIKFARPGIDAFIRLIKDGKIHNCPVTVADVKRWLNIYGPDVGTLKGRSVRETPSSVNVDPNQIVYGDVIPIVIAVDIFFVEGIPFFVAICKNLNLLTVHNLASREAPEIMEVLRKLQGLYRKQNYRIDTIMSDGEGAIKKLDGLIGDIGIKVNTASKGEHVPEVERAIRQVKERVRSFYTTLPYKLDETLLVHLVYY